MVTGWQGFKILLMMGGLIEIITGINAQVKARPLKPRLQFLLIFL